MPITETAFTALRIEGGLLPAEFLQRVATFEAAGQSPADYGIPPGLTLRDEIGRYWTISEALWKDYRQSRQRTDIPPERTGVDRWLLRLLRDVLGYADTTPVMDRVAIGGRVFPITHRAQGGSLPLLLTVAGRELDRSNIAFGDDGRRRAPQAAMQEFLNADPTVLWGLLANGPRLRILRKNPSLTRPAYIEADLERIFEERLYSDFAAFWLLAHSSRLSLGANGASVVRIEQWRLEGAKTGQRALARLRVGVTTALRELGSGFVEHPENESLRAGLSSGTMTADHLHQQLLRLVYRLLFMFTAEERDLLHAPEADADARELYAQGYSLGRLRDRARFRRHYDRHGDLWVGLTVAFRSLAQGAAPLGLPALGGLFERDLCPDLDQAMLPNARLLSAIHALAFFSTEGNLQRVNYRDMGTEELGSVYESLLELHPVVEVSTWTFSFVGDDVGTTTRGSERKLSGSYYTPDVLVQELLRLSLDPIIERTTQDHPDEPRAALLHLKVLDPACGSGHFLLGAARRLADAVARLDGEGDLPDELLRRRALREVVRRCIFGVDRNPLSVELCKAALWIETIEPGRPLSFLDAHIKCGDSLIGVADLSALASGIPDDAYTEFETDDKTYARDLKRRNKEQRDGRHGAEMQLRLPVVAMPPNLVAAISALTEAPEDTVAQVEAKRRALREVEEGPAGHDLRVACDIWTAAFFIPRDRKPERPGRDLAPTTDTVWSYLRAPSAVYGPLHGTVSEIAARLHFFHWPLEFPEAAARNGFDLILGNPPWETMSPDAKEWFSPFDPTIAEMAPEPQATRIAEIRESPVIAAAWSSHCDFLYRAANFMRKSGRYRLFAPGSLGKGDFNVWRMFCELALTQVRPGGYASQLVPENFYNGSNAASIRSELLAAFALHYMIVFKNANKVWFSAVHAQTNFALYAAERGRLSDDILVAFGVDSTEKLFSLKEKGLIRLPVVLIREFSPDALAIAEVAHPADIAIVRKLYVRLRKFGEDLPNSSMRRYMAEVHMGNDREEFGNEPDGVPLYQGSMVSHFDHRSQGYVSGHGRRTVWRDLPFGDPSKSIIPQWRLAHDDIPAKLGNRWRKYRIGFCDIANPLNQRTLMAAEIPAGTVCGHKVPTITFEPEDRRLDLLWLGVANAVVIDYVVRKKVTLTMSFTVVDSLPLPRTYSGSPLEVAIAGRSLRLSATGPEMTPFWQNTAPLLDIDFSNDHPADEPSERERLRTEIDVLVARDLFGLNRDEMRYLLDPTDILGVDCGFETFGALQRAERRLYGEFRTRRLILEAWESLEAPVD